MYQYTINAWGKQTKWKKYNKAKAKRYIYDGLKMLVPGKLSYDDFDAVFKGEKPWSSLFLYGQKDKPRSPYTTVKSSKSSGRDWSKVKGN